MKKLNIQINNILDEKIKISDFLALLKLEGYLIIKDKNRILFKIYDRPTFFAGMNINFTGIYSLSVVYIGVSKEYQDFDKLLIDFKKYLSNYLEQNKY